MSNWKMNIIDGKSYLLLEVIVRKVKGSWNSSVTGHLCYFRYFCTCAHYNDVYSPMKFSNEMHTISLHSWWGGGGGVGACYTDYGVFQDCCIIFWNIKTGFSAKFLS